MCNRMLGMWMGSGCSFIDPEDKEVPCFWVSSAACSRGVRFKPWRCFGHWTGGARPGPH